jgi:predicted  nucleic acid-binding Zn-ribbon protein
MPAKKMKAKTTRGVRAATVIDRWAAMELELDRLQKLVSTTESDRMYMEQRLAEADELLAKGTETMREHAGGLVKLAEDLRRRDLVIWNLEGNIRELAAELEWWRGQAADYQSELLAYVRDEARHAKPEVDPPLDDSQDIQALQDHALRGGVA